MATFYLDPVNGNDANDGTTFANRWLTLTSGATAARTAPGDTIRVIASPDATSLGQSATWTDNSRTVTLTSAVTSEVKQATAAWTTVTNTTSTTSTDRKFGSTSSSLSVAGAFTTGLSHYTATTNGNYSSYQQITFWIKQTSGTLASGNGEISLKLCSDTLGATPVDTFNIPRIRSLNQWQAFTIDKGSNLGSSIQSVALYINTDRGAQTFLINNINAVKASSSADSLSLTSLIGKNSGTEGWYPIDSINGTAVVLRTAGTIYNLSQSGTPSGYSGSTGSVTTYKREPLILPSGSVATAASSTTFGAIQESGSSGSVITYSGGWDRTNMSSQTGDTYISGVNGLGYGIYSNAFSYVTLDKINLYSFGVGVYLNGVLSNVIVTAKDITANDVTNINIQNNAAAAAGPNNCTFTVDNVNCAGQGGGTGLYLFRSVKNNKFTFVNCLSGWNYGIRCGGDGGFTNPYINSKNSITVTNLNRHGTYGAWLSNFSESLLSTANIIGNLTTGIYIAHYQSSTFVPGCTNSKIIVTTALTGNSGLGVNCDGASGNTFVFTGANITNCTSGMSFNYNSNNNVVIGGTFSSNSARDIYVNSGLLTCINTTLNSTTKYTLFETGLSRIYFQKYQATANDHRQYYDYGTILTDTTTRHTASGISWAISPTSTTYVSSDFPMTLPVARVACNANAQVTANVYVYRSNTGLTTKLVCRGGQIAGVTNDVSTSASGSASAWEQLTINFTPTEAGVVDIEVQAYGGTTYTVYVDDLSITQA